MTKNKVFGFWSGIYIVSALLGAALTAIYLNLEDAVYYWDFAGYFDRFNEQGALLAASPVLWLGQLKTSIATEDLILAPLMPFHLGFGGSRLSYIAGIVTVYLIPTALFMGRMSHMEAVSEAPSSRTLLAVWIAAFLYTPFWAPTLRGLPDIAGCLALAAATYYLWKPEFLTREPVSSGIRARSGVKIPKAPTASAPVLPTSARSPSIATSIFSRATHCSVAPPRRFTITKAIWPLRSMFHPAGRT